MDNLNTNSKIVLEKLQQLLKKYLLLQKDNETLSNDYSALQKKENDYKVTIEELNQKVNILQAASGQMTSKDQKDFEKKISKYIKELDKCIGILSE
jgi:poly-D-alanine transfer protein DltD